jgi:putative DNA primase/helicase
MTADRKAATIDYLTRVYGGNQTGGHVIWAGQKQTKGFRGKASAGITEVARAIAEMDSLGKLPGPEGITDDDVAAHLDVYPGSTPDAARTTILDNRRQRVREGKTGVYVRGTTLARNPGWDRGSNDDSAKAFLFSLDLDTAGANHKGSNLPPDFEACAKIVTEAGLPEPTLWISSGGGFYPQWLFTHAADLSDPQIRATVADGFHRLSKAAQVASDTVGGWDMDTTSDLARVWRVPGTMNRKLPDPADWSVCHVIDGAGSGERIRWQDLFATVPQTLDELDATVREIKARRKGKPSAAPKATATPAVARNVHGDTSAPRMYTPAQAERELRKLAVEKLVLGAFNVGVRDLSTRAGRFVPEVLDESTARGLVLELIAEHGDHPADDTDRTTLDAALHHGMRATPRYEAGDFRTADKARRPMPHPGKPVKVAQVFAETDAVHWVFHNDDFYAWTGTRYALMDEPAVKRVLQDQLEDAYWTDGEGKVKDWDPNSRSIQEVYQALALKKLSAAAPVNVIAMANGVYDVATGTLLPHSPDRFNIASLPFAYDPDATCPGFLAFLNSSLPDDPDSHALLQEWIGYLLSGRTDLQKMMILQGEKRSGKGTIGRLVKALLGEDAVAAPQLDHLGTTFGPQTLLNKSLALMADVIWNTRNAGPAMSFLLGAIGEDPMDIQRKNRITWTGKLPARWMAMSNREVQFKDPSGAMAARLLIIRFRISFLGREDRTLDDRLRAELPGIFNWALEGLRRLDGHGGRFTIGADAHEAVEEVRIGGNPLVEWLESGHVVYDAMAETLQTDLFEQYQAWAQRGHYLVAKGVQVFARDLAAVNVSYKAKRIRKDGVQAQYGPFKIVKRLDFFAGEMARQEPANDWM